LKDLFSKVIIPRAVYSEVAVPGEVGYEEIVEGVQDEWIIVKEIWDRMSAYELTPLLHRGEAEAIILAEEAKADYLIVDERVARHIAASRGIRVIGILGILSLCIKFNLININEALRLSQTLIEGGYIIDREVNEDQI